jgi:hypothetical protein
VRKMALAVVAWAAVFAPSAMAAPPRLTAVGHDRMHPWAEWTLTPGSEAATVQVADSPEVGTDGYFWEENVVEFDVLEPTQTRWLSSSRLDPGTYYLHVSSFTPGCLECRVREWSNVLQLVVTAPPPPPPRYEASARSIHPDAIRQRGGPWTYTGDTLRVAFRNANAAGGTTQTYRVCWQGVGKARCRARTIRGRTWDAWRLRVLGPWVPCRGQRLVGSRDIHLMWSVGGRIVARRSVKIYECS